MVEENQPFPQPWSPPGVIRVGTFPTSMWYKDWVNVDLAFIPRDKDRDCTGSWGSQGPRETLSTAGIVLTQGLVPPTKVKRLWPAGPPLLWSLRQKRKGKNSRNHPRGLG